MVQKNTIKLPSAKEVLVLEILGSAQEMYGLEMVKKSENGLKRGTIYVLLNRMEDKGYIDSRVATETTHSGLPRRLYKITGLGQHVLSIWRNAQMAFDAMPDLS